MNQPKHNFECTSNSITVFWEKDSRYSGSYVVKYRKIDGKKNIFSDMKTSETKIYILNLQTRMDYEIKVFVEDEDGENHLLFTDKVSTKDSVANKIIEKSTLDEKGTVVIYKLIPLTITTLAPGVRKCEMISTLNSDPTECITEEKTVMMMGATGSGKSTLIDAMINYVAGVSVKDEFRFRLIDLTKDESAKNDRQFLSMTDGVTCYRLPRIEDAKIDFILNIIDTPGFGDTRGKSFDENIPKLIEGMFKKVIESVDAICLVIPISCVRLTENQRYLFESVSKLFGKDIEHNILVCITFDDGGNPSVLDALKEAKIPHQKEIFFRFNNSDLFVESPSVESWNKRDNNFKNFFAHLRKVRTQSLSKSVDVMHTRRRLQNQLRNIKKNVREQVIDISQIRNKQRILKENEDKINANKDFTYTELITVTERIYSDTWCLNCPYCKKTCHVGCWSIGYVLNWTCEVMYLGTCTNCNCYSTCHTNEQLRYITERKEEHRTNEDLKKEYEKSSKEALSTKEMLAIEKNKLITKLQELDDLFKKTKSLISNLEREALLPNTMTLDGYIDQIIKEEDPRKPEASDTVQILEKLKDKIRQNEKIQDLIKDLINI